MSQQPIYVFAKWQVQAGQLQAVLEFLKKVAGETVLEEGNLLYKVSQSRTEADTLILFEGYKDEEAQKAHLNTPHYQQLVIGQIVPLLKSREVVLTTPIIG